MKLSEMIEVLQAAERGEDIQFAFPNGMWCDLLRPNIEASWEFGRYNYRVKPKPLECWVTVLEGGLCSTVHSTEKGALGIANTSPTVGWTVRKFREVVE